MIYWIIRWPLSLLDIGWEPKGDWAQSTWPWASPLGDRAARQTLAEMDAATQQQDAGKGVGDAF